MVKILIPRSNSISAKTIVPTDFEKFFDDVVNDYIVSGFTVTATAGTNRSVDISTGTGRVKGYFINNDALETTAHTFSSDDTHYLYIQLTRDIYSEPESWGYTSNTTGTPPTDSIVIAKVITVAGDISSIDQTVEFKKMNHLHTFAGTGSEINALTNYAGQHAYCTVSGSGFIAGEEYKRNSTNTVWKSTTSVTGEIKFGGWALASIPLGYLLCDGSAVSRSTYAELFTAVSTRFGVGDGSTTFNLPDLRSVFPRGSPAATEAGGTGGESTHVLTTAEMPSHTHIQDAHTHTTDSTIYTWYSGSLVKRNYPDGTTNTGSTTATNQNTGGDGAHENKPPFQNFLGIIAY